MFERDPSRRRDAGETPLPDGQVDAFAPGCPVCRLRDAEDRARTRHWLATAGRWRGWHDALAILCCPLHSWRVWEIACAPRRVQGGAEGASAYHSQAANLLARALGAAAQQLKETGEHFADTGLRGRITHLLGDMPPALLCERPSCPLCKPYNEHADDAGLFTTFIAAFADLPSDQRWMAATALCSRDRRLCHPYAGAFAELAPVPRRYAAVRLPEWWTAPTAGMEDRSFVNQLLADDGGLPDGACPACHVRLAHERGLLAEVRRVAAEADRSTMRAPKPSEMGGIGAPELEAILADLCARHAALLVAEQRGAMREEKVLPEAEWPVGTLRAVAHESGCVLCSTLWGWNLARMEGLRRAAGSAALYEPITEQLQAVLARRHYRFCLLHWRQVTASAPREVTLTLLPAQERGVGTLLAEARQHADRLRQHGGRQGLMDGDEDERMEPCGKLVATLAGLPA